MATEAHIPAPLCEKIREEGENIVYQATNISLYKLPQVVKTQGDYTPNEPPTIEGEIFLTTPSIGEVHYEAKNISPNATEKAENLNVEVTTSNVKTIKEEIPCKEEYIPIQKGNGTVTKPEDAGMVLEDSGSKSREDAENQSKPLEEIVTNLSNPEVTEKSTESSSIEVGCSQVDCDEQLEKESEKLPLTEVSSTEDTYDNESTVIHKVKIEDEDLGKAEVYENEKSTCTLLKEEAQVEEPLESLHVAAEDIKTSNLEQDTTTASSPEDMSINTNLQGITSDYIDEKTIDAVDPQNEVLEKFSTIISNENTEENSMIKVDSLEMKIEDHLEKESQEMSSPQPLAAEASGDESTVMHDAQIEEGGLRIAELCENEQSTENSLLEIESKIEEPVESLFVSPQDIKTSALCQEIERTSSVEEQSLTAHPQGILDEKTNDRTVDAAETEETLEVQNVATFVSNEKTEGDSLIQVDDSQLKDEEHLEKENEKPSSIKYSTLDANDDELIVMDEVKIEDENPKRAELFEKEKNIESTLLKEEVQIEKPVESFNKALDDIKASGLDQHTEITSSIEEHNLIENTQGISCDKAEEKASDAVDTKEETLHPQNVAINVLNKDIDENTLIPVDDSQLKHEEHLEEEIGKPSPAEALTEDANDDESTIVHEVKLGDECLPKAELFQTEENTENTLLEKETITEKPIEYLQIAHEDNKPPTGIACSLEEQSLIANPQAIMGDKTVDPIDTEEVSLEVHNVAAIIPHEGTEENSLNQVDCSQMEHEEHLEKESENPSLKDSLTGDTNEDESKTMCEPEIRDEDLIKAELLENEKNMESTLEKEALMEKSIDSLQVGTEDVKASTSGQDTETSSNEEQVLTANPQEIFCGKTGEETIDAADAKDENLLVENVAINVPNEDIDKNSSIQLDGSEYEAHLEKEIEKPSLTEASIEGANVDKSITIHETKVGNAYLRNVELFDNDTNTDNSLLKKEVTAENPIEYLQIADDGDKAYVSSEDTKTTYSLEEQTANAQGILGEEIIDATEEVTLETENVATTIPHGEYEESSLIQVNCSQPEYEEHLEKKSEKPSLTEASTGNTNEDKSKTMHALKVRDEDQIKAELLENDKNAESTSVKEAAPEEKPIDSSQVATEDIKVSGSDQDTETSFIGEQILTVKLKEISGNKTEEETIDAADTEEETLENVSTNVPNGDNEDNSENQIDGSQMKHEEHLETESEKPSAAEVSTGNNNYDKSAVHEVKFVDEDLIKTDLSENEKDTASALVKEASVESVQVATEDIKASASGHDREISSLEVQCLTENPQEIKGDKKEDETNDAIQMNEEIPEDKIVAIDVPNEDTKPYSMIQVDDSQMKPETHMETETEKLDGNANDESKIMHEASTLEEGLTIKNNDICSGKEDHMKDVTDQENQDNPVTSNGATEDQSKETENDPNDVVGQVLEEKVDEDREITVTRNDVEIQMTDNQHHVEAHSEATEDETINISSEVGEIYEESNDNRENDKNAESTSVKEAAPEEEPIDSSQVATEDIKVSGSDQDTETSSIDEQILTVQLKEISGNKTEEETIDAADTEEETLENVSTKVPNGDNEDNSENQIDESQMKHEEHLETESEKSSATEVSTGNNNDDKSTVHEVKFVDEDLIKADLSENEKDTASAVVKEASIESVQVATEDIKASASGHDKEISALEEQCLTENPQEIKGDKKEDETNDAIQTNEEIPEDKIVAIDVPNEDTKDYSMIQVDDSQMKPETYMETETEKLDGNANDESKTMHEASTLEEGLSIKDNDICSGKEDHMKDVTDQENQDNSVTSNGATEDQSKETENDPNDVVGQVLEEKVDEDREITVTRNDVEMQMTDNQHHVEAHSEATEDETINISSEVGEIYEESSDNRDNSTEIKEIKVEASNEDEKKEMEPDTQVAKETENAIEINEEEGYLKDLQMTTTVDIAAYEEKGSDSVTAENLCAKVSDVNEDMVVTVAEGLNCEQEESSITDVSEEIMRISNENVANVTSLASEAPEVISEKTDVEKMGVLDDVSVTKPANENLEEAFQKESTEAQVPDGEKETELMQHDEEAETGGKEIKDEQPINASQDVSKSNEVNDQEEKRNSDSCKEISDNSNTVALEEKQNDDLNILAHINNVSMGKTEEDVPLCGATVDESDILQQMQKIDETSLPAPDENIIEKTDSKESEVAEDATKDKYVEHLEQEETTKSLLDDQTHPESEQEEAQCRQEKVILDEKTDEIKDSTSIQVFKDFLQKPSKETSEMDSFISERELTINREELYKEKKVLGQEEEEEANIQIISDVSPAAPVMTEARDHDDEKLLYEALEETFTCKVAGEGDIVSETTDTTECTVINNNTVLEDIHVNSKSIGELETKLEDDTPETVETTPDATKGQEVDITSSVLVSERAASEHAFCGVIEEKSDSKEVEFAHGENKAGNEFKDQDVKELKPQEIPLQANNTEEGVARGNETEYETKCANVGEVTEGNITYVPGEQLQKAVSLYNDLETSLETEKLTDESTNKMACRAEEKSIEVGQEGSSKDEDILNYKVDDTIDYNTKSKEIHEPEKLEKVLESTPRVQSSDKISEAEKVITEEENLEAAKETKSDKIVAEEKIESKETTQEAEETMKVDILNEKIEKDDEDVQDYHLRSCKEEVIRESHLKDEIKQEEGISTEENFKVTKNASENVKERKVIEKASDKAVEEPEDTLMENESTEISLHQKEQVVNVEEITTILDIEEEAHGLDHVCIKTGTEGSTEEVNSSDVAFLEDENNITGADDLDIEMTKDEGLPNEDSKISEIDAVAGKLPKLDENVICEDASITTVHITIEDSEDNKGNANTIMMQHQEDDHTSKLESLLFPEFTQGKESEKQDQKDENCSLDEAQPKEEENVMLEAETSEEAQKANPTEDENKNTYIETEKLDFSSPTTDKSKESYSYGNQDAPKDNESKAKDEFSEEEYPNESTEPQIFTVSKDIELMEQASKATRIDPASVLEETGGDILQEEEVSDGCNEMIETSTSTESTKISTSQLTDEHIVENSLKARDQETQDQLTKLHDLPQESHVNDSEVKMAEKHGAVDLQGVSDISEEVQELNEGSVEVSKEENDFPQESHVKDSEVKMAEKDGLVELQSVSDVKEDVREVNEGSVEVSKEETDLPQGSHVKDSEVKMAEKDGPVDLQSASDIREDVQELNEGFVEVSKEENSVEADPRESIEAKCSSGGQEADAIQKTPISETLKQEIEEQQQERTSLPISEAKEMNCEEEKKTDTNYNDLIETSHFVTKEMVSETNTCQSSIEDAAQSARDCESQTQIESLPILPSIKCLDTEIAEKDVVKEHVTYLPSEHKHAVPEADPVENVNPEISDTNISVIQNEDSAKCSQGEDEILKPSIPEQGEAKCDHGEEPRDETTKAGEKSEPTEIDKASLSDPLQVSIKETSQTGNHSADEKEPTFHGEYLQVEKPNETEHEEAKTDDKKDNEEESCEQKTSDSGSEAPVMVDAGDADVKVAHKKSHNILSGVGSKVKHSIAKVKKVITGKSSHPKPPSPKSGEKC
ncbi:hypothetical protein BUALT_Bualt04G0162500 [Buddleja alternifolia]|uniref:Titin-like n=1 Tax=Buddleja alternifolia TaxID=168488 RepID=A0AAV6XXH5_9LAMI|nr:hypothetical protein BUALT_Bualt04G0162500 [Buddleja alternifolia]